MASLGSSLEAVAAELAVVGVLLAAAGFAGVVLVAGRVMMNDRIAGRVQMAGNC